jgi:hypothetical protein
MRFAMLRTLCLLSTLFVFNVHGECTKFELQSFQTYRQPVPPNSGLEEPCRFFFRANCSTLSTRALSNQLCSLIQLTALVDPIDDAL